MTTEDDFRRMLFDNPKDWTTYTIYADFLQDRDDPRAEGYRAFGVLHKRPYYGSQKPRLDKEDNFAQWYDDERMGGYHSRTDIESDLPTKWFRLLPDTRRNSEFYATDDGPGWTPLFVALDDAALAFAHLPDATKRKILKKFAVST